MLRNIFFFIVFFWQIQELSSQLSAFHTSVSGTGELLEHEASERYRLEEELEQSKVYIFFHSLTLLFLHQCQTVIWIFYRLSSILVHFFFNFEKLKIVAIENGSKKLKILLI